MTTYNLSAFGLISLSGPDAEKFLQGQVTCDVKEVTETQNRLGAHCDPKGRVQFLFRLFKQSDIYYLLLPKEIIPLALTFLKKYAVFSKVKLEDVSDNWSSNGMIVNEIQKYFDHADKSISLELLNIRNGIPTITLANTNEFTPHDLNLPALNGVSFNKGCYTGQEIVARMHYLGKLKQHLQHLSFSSQQTPLTLTKLCLEDKRVVGRLINVAETGHHHYEALALLQDAALDKEIYLENSDNLVKII